MNSLRRRTDAEWRESIMSLRTWERWQIASVVFYDFFGGRKTNKTPEWLLNIMDQGGEFLTDNQTVEAIVQIGYPRWRAIIRIMGESAKNDALQEIKLKAIAMRMQGLTYSKISALTSLNKSTAARIINAHYRAKNLCSQS